MGFEPRPPDILAAKSVDYTTASQHLHYDESKIYTVLHALISPLTKTVTVSSTA